MSKHHHTTKAQKQSPHGWMRRLFAAAALSLSLASSAYAQWDVSNPSVRTLVETLQTQHGFSASAVQQTLSQANQRDDVLRILTRSPAPSSQPSPGTWSRYRAKFVTQSRISGGVKFWRQYESALASAERRYGVPAEYIVAILGVESAYGQQMGNLRVIDSLATGAFNAHRRQDLYRKELIAFFLMTRDNQIDPLQPVGSYAGAMGYGQFLPSSVRRYAQDADGDGQRRIDEALDAIDSVAYYFQQHGWRQGEQFSVPAVLQGDGHQALTVGWRGNYSAAALQAAGVYAAEQLQSTRFSLIRLRHNAFDEYRLGGQNFYVVTRYNNSTRYAMAVHELAQRIKAAR